MERPGKDQRAAPAGRRISDSRRRIADELGLILAVGRDAQQPRAVADQQTSIGCPMKRANFLPLPQHGFGVPTLAASAGKNMQTLGGLLLHRRQSLAVSGERQSRIPVGVASDGLNRFPGTGNESDLRSRVTWAGLLVVGKDSAAIGLPF